MKRADEINLIAEALAGQNWEGTGVEHGHEQVKLLTKKFTREEVWDIVHRASVIAETQYERLEDLLLNELTAELD